MPVYLLHPLLSEPLELPGVGVSESPTADVANALENSEGSELLGLYGRSISELPVDQRAELLEEIRLEGGSLDDLDLPQP